MRYLFAAFLTISYSRLGFAQEFKNHQLRKLSSYGIITDSINYTNTEDILHLKSILFENKRRKENKIPAVVIASFGAINHHGWNYGAVHYKKR